MSNQPIVEDRVENLNPRNYQLELYRNASTENTIVYLQTGSGKTLIAVLLIRDLAPEVTKKLTEGGRRIVFLVPTVVLAQQQANYIRRHTCLKIGEYYGELGVDLWKREKWAHEIENNNVLVMTAQLFVNAVNHSFMSISQVRLLVIDECHSAVKDSPMKQALLLVNEARNNYGNDRVPRILGLTAALFRRKCKPRDVAKIIQKLETSMHSRVRTAEDLKSALQNSTKPIEIICEYASLSSNSENSGAEWLTQHVQELLHTTISDLNTNFKSTDESGVDNLKELTDILREISILTDIFGPYGTNHAVSLFTNEIKKLEFQTDLSQSTLRGNRLVVNVLREINDVCEFTFSELNDPRNLLRLFTTPHVTRLLEILRGFSPTSPNAANNVVLCSLIFVERRSSANVLYHILKAASKCDPELAYLNPLFTLGQASGNPNKGKSKENRDLGCNQKEIIKRFRDGRCNILVATSVLEEGVDVRACNLVVRFNGIKTYCDYVQSKGRARSPNALYILMVPEIGLDDFLDTLASFHAIEQMLLNPSALMLTLDEPEDQELEELWDRQIKPYCPYPGGPRVTLLSSMGLLNWYCASLPSDGLAVLTPYWVVDEIGKNFQCKLLLPINSPLREELVSEIMPSKRLAKREVALKACIRLHQLGELDNQHLLPLSKSLDVTEETDDSEDPSQVSLNKGYYSKGISRIFDHSFVPPYHLYLINYEVVNPKLNQFDPNQSKHRLGFLTCQRLPSVNPFGVFAPIGQINVTFTEISSYLRLTPAEVQQCHLFQQYIFERIIELFKDEQYNLTRCSYIVVPINSKQIDFDFISQQLNPSISDLQSASNVDNHSVYRDAVVSPTHNKLNERINYYYVDAIKEEMTPLSPFPNQSFPTYFDYYKDRYKITIKNFSQPLLEVSKESFKTFNFLTPKYLDRKEKSARGKIFLVPELCDLHRFPASLCRQSVWIPSIFYRLNSLLLADELRIEIQAVTGLGVSLLPPNERWEPLQVKSNLPRTQLTPESGSDESKSNKSNLNSSNMDDIAFQVKDAHMRSSLANIADMKELKNSIWSVNLFDSENEREERDVSREYGAASELIANTRQLMIERQGLLSPSIEMDYGRGADNSHDPVLGPSPGQILQALTTTGANAGFDLERLEVIGDSLLKLATSIRIYCDSPNHFHEGKMTHLRVKQISNLNLYRLGQNKSLPQLMTATKFIPVENWLPTCYLPNDSQDMESNNPKLVQLITKKTIADSVEALFGLYLNHHGIKGALKVMKWMGVEVPDSGENDCYFNSNPPSPLLIESNDVERLLNDHLVGFDTLESDINYRFRNRLYLLQAFSHASYCDNRLTSCYQRLEFLGDAVFDYLISRYLYDNSKEELTPGVLSDMRSALVNNITFAVLAVRYGLHRFLKHMVPDMHHAIDNFVKQQELCDHVLPDEILLTGTKNDPIATEVEAPKVLGDIFESLVGAVFLDSNMSLDVVWKVFYPLIRSEIDACTRSIPMSPIRKLYELFSDLVKFETVDKTPDGRVCMAVKIKDHERVYKGVGRNSRMAKNTAAKYALSQLNKSTN